MKRKEARENESQSEAEIENRARRELAKSDESEDEAVEAKVQKERMRRKKRQMSFFRPALPYSALTHCETYCRKPQEIGGGYAHFYPSPVALHVCLPYGSSCPGHFSIVIWGASF